MSTAIRLDKWLWAARFYKTRSLARQMVQAGKVTIDGQRCKPARTVAVGNVVKFPRGYDIMEVEVLALTDQRRAAPEAQLLYQETESSKARREKEAELRKLGNHYNPHPDTKPDKKQRRDLRKFRHAQQDPSE